MFRLASILYAIVGTTLAGIFLIVALVTGYDTALFIIGAVATGAMVALPGSYFVASAISNNE